MELFDENVEKYGLKKAKRIFTYSVINLARPSLIRNSDFKLEPKDFRPGTRFFVQFIVSFVGATLLFTFGAPVSIGHCQIFKDEEVD